MVKGQVSVMFTVWVYKSHSEHKTISFLIQENVLLYRKDLVQSSVLRSVSELMHSPQPSVCDIDCLVIAMKRYTNPHTHHPPVYTVKSQLAG